MPDLSTLQFVKGTWLPTSTCAINRSSDLSIALGAPDSLVDFAQARGDRQMPSRCHVSRATWCRPVHDYRTMVHVTRFDVALLASPLDGAAAQCINQIVAARLRHCYYHGLHAIDATPARRRGGVVSHCSIQPDRTSCCYPTHWIHLRAGPGRLVRRREGGLRGHAEKKRHRDADSID